ncbi:uncharacterized protein EI90DRAFT_1490019 [Cantharellus anzutake]|uniref:uncharacterized protein n=1 Tax=Cantharellus anzutake TaxID=1750568 RepID=UPI00190694E7|nr:uncharacterized protein EI90DRAFT_1490019 [Cantharellus anzutake]KAF8328911.1 hypothetical protein EI90DRAFT_1490019 [Cantharellus anzutake]
MHNIVHVTLYVALFFKQIWSQGSPLSEDAASVEIHGTPPFSSSLPLQRTNGLLFLSSTSVPTSWSSLHTRVMATSTAALIPSKTFSYLSDSSSIVTGSHHDPVPLKTVPNQSDSFLSIPSESKTASPTYPSPDTAAAIPTTQTHQYPAPSLLAISLLAPSYSNYHPSATSNSASVLQTNTDASTSENISTSPSRSAIAVLAVFAILTAFIVAIFLFQKYRSRKQPSDEDYWAIYGNSRSKDKEKHLPYSINYPIPANDDHYSHALEDTSIIEKGEPPLFESHQVSKATPYRDIDNQTYPRPFMTTLGGRMDTDGYVFVTELPSACKIAGRNTSAVSRN